MTTGQNTLENDLRSKDPMGFCRIIFICPQGIYRQLSGLILIPEKPDLLTPYTCRVARNTALKRLRQTTAERRDSRFDLSIAELSDCIPDRSIEDNLQALELGRSLNRFLATLTEENRTLFLRRYWFGDSVQDIAKLTGLRENTVAVRLNRIRTKLKEHLIREGSL